MDILVADTKELTNFRLARGGVYWGASNNTKDNLLRLQLACHLAYARAV